MNLRTVVAGFALIAFGAGSALADDKAAAPSAEDQEMMKKWMEYSTPGEPHKILASFVGQWETSVKSWMDPNAPVSESKGSSENKMVLGGRYLEQRFEGTFMDQPFQGLGYTGYDNYKKKYMGTWMDTMGTGMMLSTGSGDAPGKKFTFTGTMDDVMTGKVCNFEETLTVVDADHHTFEMWAPGPDGKPYKNMEIHYTRKK